MNAQRHLAILVIALSAGNVASAGATRQFTFQNDTGQAANDLHVAFKQAVEPVAGTSGNYGPFPNGQGSGTSTIDFDGGTVAPGAGASATIRFTTGSSKITIKKWWWTNNGRRIGRVQTRTPDQRLPLGAHFYQLNWLGDDGVALYPDSAVGEMALELDGSEAALLEANGGAYVNVVIESTMPSPSGRRSGSSRTSTWPFPTRAIWNTPAPRFSFVYRPRTARMSRTC